MLFSLIIKKIFWQNPSYRKLYWKYKHLIDPKWPSIYFNDKKIYGGRNRNFLVNYICKLKWKSILELGSASGLNLFLIEKKKKNIEKIEGIDISNYCVNEGKKILKNFKSKIVLRTGDATSTNYDKSSFDIVFISGVLMDLRDNDTKKIISEGLRISKNLLLIHIANYKLHASLKIKDHGVVYNDHYLRDYHLFIKKNFSKFLVKSLKINKNTSSYPKKVNFSKLNHIIMLKK